MSAQPDRDLAARLRALEDAAPRLYSRWSEKAWRLACAGPATRLWAALDGAADGAEAMEDYLFLLREAIGLQYLAATRPEDLEPGAPAHGFLAVMLCETLPRLLPALSAADRARVLAQVWNVGEKLVGKPVWLDRYLAARLPELADLARFDEFLARAVGEGLDELPPSTWQGARRVSIADPARVDRAFLPGDMHLATPSVVCVHDRRRAERHVALLLRRARPVVCLGATPCLGHDGDRNGAAPAAFVQAAARESAGEVLTSVVAAGGFAVFSHALSQRVWVVESER